MRSRAMFKMLTVPLLLCALVITSAQTGSRTNRQSSVPLNYWPIERSQPLIDKTQTVRLAPELSQLGSGERKAVAKLLEVGKIFQDIYEDQRHQQALASLRRLEDKAFKYAPTTVPETRRVPFANLLMLYRLFQ